MALHSEAEISQVNINSLTLCEPEDLDYSHDTGRESLRIKKKVTSPQVNTGVKENLPLTESTAAQTTIPHFHTANITGLAFLHNPSLMQMKEPKTPSPLPKSKVLDVADELLSIAENKFASLESKNYGPLLSSRSRNANGSISTKKTMTDYQGSPTRSSLISEIKLKNKLKPNHQVPQNSPSSNKSKGEENYYQNNGEKKVFNPKSCPHQRRLTQVSCDSSPSSQGADNSKNTLPTVNQFSMFYEQQQLVERSSQKVKENNSTTVIFTSEAKVLSSTNSVLKQEVQTSTEPETAFQPRNLQKYTPNSSIISMKTSKPEEDIDLGNGPPKLLNVQKMPSVNIRPEFTIQKGPKINIVASNSVPYKPKRKNTEYFDIVYPPRNPTEKIFISNDNNSQYVCNRHIFPSGVLIPSSQNDVTRDNSEAENYSFEEKKVLLISLIRSLTEKVEKQASKERKSCCRLVCSLPLLVSVVQKIQVNCVNCLDLLHKQLDRLVNLMKEELRSQRDISEDHCCKLDETVQYQIVELELVQNEIPTRQPHSETLRTFKHQDKEEPLILFPKKSVSFESVPVAPDQSTTAKNCLPDDKSQNNRHNTSKNINFKAKNLSSTSEKPKTPGDKKFTIKVYKEQIKNKISSFGKNKTNKQFKTTSGSEERTVVGQVVKGLTTKKSILKNDSVPQKTSIQSLNNKDNLNALFEVVDDREASREFDFWIKERSLKIKQIHEELNKIVESSMEKYVQAQHPEYNWSEKPSPSDENTNHTNPQEGNLTFKQTINSQRIEIKESDHQNADISSQEIIQEYAEDFEEDVEEFSNSTSSEGSGNHTQAEVQNDSSSPESEEINLLTEKEKIDGTANKSTIISDKLTSQLSIEDASLINSGKGKKLVQEVGETKTKKMTSSNITKVDMATSPIHFQLSETISHNAKMSYPNEEKSFKTNTALSPINMQISDAPTVFSSSAQTEVTGSKFIVDNRADIQLNYSNDDNMNILPPPNKLVSAPIENVLKLFLDTTEENAFSLQTKSSNQKVNLTVHLPTNLSVINNGSPQILELETESEKPYENFETEPPVSQIHSLTTNVERKRNINISMKDNKPSSSKHEYDHVNPPWVHTLSDKTMKDIIEPTVSEVLKQIHDPKFIFPGTSQHLDEVDNKETPNCLKCSELTKPNIFLQTKHNVWKKCEDYTMSNLIDLASPKQTMDSSNQTEAEKQNVHIQVATSLTESVCDKGISARKHDNLTGDCGTSYLTLMQPPPSETLMSSVSYSSTHRTSSGSSSSSTTSSKSKDGVSVQMETLSEGEVIAGPCVCNNGDVCTICIPRLDLSFGELKTKKKLNKIETISSISSDSDCSVKQYDPKVLLNMPLYLEPKPPSFIPTSVSGINKSRLAGLSFISQRNLVIKEHNQFSSNSNFQSKGNYTVSKNFSDVANSVMTELNEEYLKSNMAYSKDKRVLTKSIKSVNTVSTSNQVSYHSSSDSEKTGRILPKNKRSSPGNKSKFKTSLVIKSPLETPKIDMVVENSEADSISSYQTSVTSVSVDNLPAILSSHSSGELHHLSGASS